MNVVVVVVEIGTKVPLGRGVVCCLVCIRRTCILFGRSVVSLLFRRGSGTASLNMLWRQRRRYRSPPLRRRRWGDNYDQRMRQFPKEVLS